MILKTILSGAMKFRFALWAIDLALPETSALKIRLKAGVSGLVAAVAGAIISAFLIILMIGITGYGFYYFDNLTALQAVGLTLLFTMLCVVGLLFYSRNKFKQMFAAIDKPSHPPKLMSEKDPLGDVLNAFLEGLMTTPAAEDPIKKHPRASS
jgi:hypothetical protein